MTRVRIGRSLRFQPAPNVIRRERRICLTRIAWERGSPGDGKGYSTEVSISLCWKPEMAFFGVYHRPDGAYYRLVYLCLIPFFPVRIHWTRSYGGSFG